MAIIKDTSRNTYYINYKFKLPNGKWQNVNIKNKDWKITGENKVGIRYMQSIEHAEIEKDKERRKISWHDGESIALNQLCEMFFRVCKSDNIDDETVYNYKLAFKNYLFPILGENTKVDKAFTMTNIDNFRSNLTSKGLKEKTVNNKLVAVKNLLKFAKKRKYISREMADDAIDLLEPLKEGNRISDNDNFFVNGEEDLRKFISSFEEIDTEWRVPVLTLFYGALRIGEWQAITLDCVDFEHGFIIIRKQISNHGQVKDHTKTGHDRIVRLPNTFMEELHKYVIERSIDEHEYIFCGAHSAHVSRHKIRDIVNKHLELAGLHHITLHGLRHSFATRMFDKGYDVKEVQEHLGHTSMETTMKYYIHYTRSKDKKDLEDLL